MRSQHRSHGTKNAARRSAAAVLAEVEAIIDDLAAARAMISEAGTDDGTVAVEDAYAALDRRLADLDLAGIQSDAVAGDEAWHDVEARLAELASALGIDDGQPAGNAKRRLSDLGPLLGTRPRRRDLADYIVEGFEAALRMTARAAWGAVKLAVRGAVAAGKLAAPHVIAGVEALGRAGESVMVHVDDYMRADGTRVSGHDRAAPAKDGKALAGDVEMLRVALREYVEVKQRSDANPGIIDRALSAIAGFVANGLRGLAGATAASGEEDDAAGGTAAADAATALRDEIQKLEQLRQDAVDGQTAAQDDVAMFEDLLRHLYDLSDDMRQQIEDAERNADELYADAGGVKRSSMPGDDFASSAAAIEREYDATATPLGDQWAVERERARRLADLRQRVLELYGEVHSALVQAQADVADYAQLIGRIGGMIGDVEEQLAAYKGVRGAPAVKMARLITTQSYRDDAKVAEKQEAGDYVVLVTPEFSFDGDVARAVLDGHHSLEAALRDGVEPVLVEAGSGSAVT